MAGSCGQCWSCFPSPLDIPGKMIIYLQVRTFHNLAGIPLDRIRIRDRYVSIPNQINKNFNGRLYRFDVRASCMIRAEYGFSPEIFGTSVFSRSTDFISTNCGLHTCTLDLESS